MKINMAHTIICQY